VTEAGPLFEISTSALVVTGVDAVELSLAEFGSVVADETVAVFWIGSGVVYDDGTEYVVVIVRDSPAGIVPSAHGYADTQSPVFDTKPSPAGVGSATDTAEASELPLFVTVTM